MSKTEREKRINSLVGCPIVEKWMGGKSDKELSRLSEEIKVLLIGHISKCRRGCHEKYGGKLPILGEE